MRALAFLALAGCGAALRIEPQADPRRVVVVAPEGAGEEDLRLALVGADGREGPPILGDYARDGRGLVFVPRYGLSPGERYRATAGGATVEYRVPLPPASEPAAVEAIYPSADRLPANLLKFYIHFSKPMREGEAIFDRIRLVDDRGKPVHDPWRRVDLWSADARRLTLWIHPGRIKRGVNLREEFGPVLEPGRPYTLEIGAEVEDAGGRPLGKAWTKRFTAEADDRSRPSVDTWTLEAPRAGTVEPLRVAFPEPMDRWLLGKHVAVLDRRGRPVAGASAAGPQERSWNFTPDAPWAADSYTLRAGEFLEDLAGNTPARLFEEDSASPAPPAAPTRTFRPR